jgi:hypothetical protein
MHLTPKNRKRKVRKEIKSTHVDDKRQRNKNKFRQKMIGEQCVTKAHKHVSIRPISRPEFTCDGPPGVFKLQSSIFFLMAAIITPESFCNFPRDSVLLTLG